MTKKERIAALEARVAQLEIRLARLEMAHQQFGPIPQTPVQPFQFPRPWDGPGVIYDPSQPYRVTCTY